MAIDNECVISAPDADSICDMRVTIIECAVRVFDFIGGHRRRLDGRLRPHAGARFDRIRIQILP